MQFTITPELRPVETGMILMGAGFEPQWMLTPPQTPDFVYSTVCDASVLTLRFDASGL